MKVTIDGIEYVPAGSVIVNRTILLKALIEEYFGSRGESLDWYEREAKNLWVHVTDTGDDYLPTVSEFLDSLASRSII